MGDLFGSFFGGSGFGGFGGGGGASRTGPAKGSTVRTSLTLTLEEAAFGCEKDVNIQHVEACDVCGGTGCEPGTTAEICPECHGSGQVRVQQRTVFGTMSTSTVCPNCRGEGKIIHQKCKACGGSGGVRRQKKVHIKVPAGIDNGQAISVRGQGDMGRNGGPAGDLIVGINVMPHARLRREGSHIYLDQAVSVYQAAMGGEIEIPSLDGKIMGNYMDLPACEPAGDLFYDIAFGEDPFYRHQGWLSGRVTTDDNFTHYRAPALTPGAPTVPEGDFVAQQAPMYYVSVDPKGKLGWESATLTYETTTAHVIEVLTEEASNDYKAFLRKLGISYILAGKDRLDYALALEKLELAMARIDRQEPDK